MSDEIHSEIILDWIKNLEDMKRRWIEADIGSGWGDFDSIIRLMKVLDKRGYEVTEDNKKLLGRIEILEYEKERHLFALREIAKHYDNLSKYPTIHELMAKRELERAERNSD